VGDSAGEVVEEGDDGEAEDGEGEVGVSLDGRRRG